MKTKMLTVLLLATVTLVSCGKKAANQSKSGDSTQVSKAKPNPYLAGETYAITHFDAGQSDAFPYPVVEGTFNVDLRQYPRLVGGPVGIIQLVSPDKNYMWGLTSGSVNYMDVSNGQWKTVASFPVPGAKVIAPEALDKGLSQKLTDVKQAENIVFNDWGINTSRILNNTYSLVDKDNVFYSATAHTVNAYTLVDQKNPAAGIKLLRTFDFTKDLAKMATVSENPTTKKYGMNIVGLGMTYDGNLVILSTGSVSVIDREFKNPIQTIQFGSDENISNSQCIDENSNIYVASDKMMHKVVWTGAKLSNDAADGAWSSPYDFGTKEPTSVKFGTGTGSTPTLMGFGDDEDKLVVITDGADRMNVVAFWRNEIPADAKQQAGTKSNRIAGQIAITCGLNPLPEFIQSEQSVVVNGYGAFVVNNIRKEGYTHDKFVDVLCGGPVFAPPVGVERVEWNPKENKWHSVWTRNDVVGTSMVPAMSSTSNIVLINGYTPKDGWELTGMDWNTGKTVTRVIFGQDNLGNGAYAIIQFLPNGDLLFNSIGGPIRVSFKK